MNDTIETLLDESRTFAPSVEFVADANIADSGIYARAAKEPVAFWESCAGALDWFERWEKPLEWELPFAKWFIGGKINASVNCLDRHAKGDRANKAALIFEGEPGDVQTFTYKQALAYVNQIANALKALGVKRGDRVCIYLPMIPELPFTMLACARIGAIHSVVFGGFSYESLHERINDAQAKLVVTADGGWRRGNVVPLKSIVDEAIEDGCPSVERVLVYERIGAPESQGKRGGTVPKYNAGKWDFIRDVSWNSLVSIQATECEPEQMDSEDLLFILYTSGSTGKPKGIMHSTGGYLTGTMATSKWVFDLKEQDIFFCTADCGWVTGHSYITYGPLANGATVLIYEGALDTPDKDRLWRVIDRHKATILYTAPTAIRTFMKWGESYLEKASLDTLRLLGSVGEPINPEAWMWYRTHVGKEKCPVVDTWWQTETGAIMITPLPGITTTKPGSASSPFPGIRPAILDEEGKNISDAHFEAIHKGEKPAPIGGYLVMTHPWPSMMRGIWGDKDRYVKTYWSRFPGYYFAGDGAKVDSDGHFWLLGRVDDIILVAGHNISTMEVESALVDHKAVAEAAVIGKQHEIKGQAIAAFVILKSGQEGTPELIDEIRGHVAHKIGPIARPDDLIITAELPKTRSGKIMRRLLRDVAEGRALGDTTTLADPNVVAALKTKYESMEG